MMLGVQRFAVVLVPLAALLLVYYFAYMRSRQWMLDVEAFEQFLEGERAYKERCDPEGLSAHLSRWQGRRRRLVFWNRVVFGATLLALFFGFVYVREQVGP